MNEEEAKPAAMVLSPLETGNIIVYARRLETLLRELGASPEAGGLHTATDELQHKLPAETVSRLHYIASIRNKAAHGDGLIENLNYPEFEATCRQVLETLQHLKEGGRPAEPKKKNTVRKAAPRADDEAVPELFSEEYRKLNKILGICACIPVVNCLYFLVMLLRGLFAARLAIVLLTFYTLALPIIIDGYQKNNQLVWGAGALLMLLVYVGGIVSGELLRRDGCRVSRVLYWLPGIDLIYFIVLLLLTIEWRLLISGAVPLGITVGAGYAFRAGWEAVGYIALSLAYLMSLLSLWFDQRHLLWPEEDVSE